MTLVGDIAMSAFDPKRKSHTRHLQNSTNSRCKVSEHTLRRSDGPLDIGLASLPVAHGDPHAALPPPCRAAEEGFTGRNDPGDDLIRSPVMVPLGCISVRIEKAHQSLVDRRLPDHLRPRQAADARDKVARVA